jgi:hypothetical protein
MSLLKKLLFSKAKKFRVIRKVLKSLLYLSFIIFSEERERRKNKIKKNAQAERDFAKKAEERKRKQSNVESVDDVKSGKKSKE